MKKVTVVVSSCGTASAVNVIKGLRSQNRYDVTIVAVDRDPLAPGRARHVVHPNWPEPVLLVRVTPDHFAAVTAHCPHCFRPLRWDGEREVAACPQGAGAFRLDGLPAEGPRDLRLRVYPCTLAERRVAIGLLEPPAE